MYATNPFRYFRPKTGKVPLYYGDAFSNIALRARRILRNRSQKEIQAAWSALSWFLREHVRAEAALAVKAVEENKLEYNNMSLALLMTYRSRINIARYHDFPKGKWSEYFSVLALGYIGLAVDDEKYHTKRHIFGGEHRREIVIQECLTYWAISAMEAVTIAEALQREQKKVRASAKKVIEKISFQKQKAAIKRHEKTNQLKAEFVEYYNNNGACK